MMEHSILDRPVWNSLSTLHCEHSRGTELAKRFESNISPFGSSIDDKPESLSELIKLIPAEGNIMYMQVDELVCPVDGHFVQQGIGIQMVFKNFKKQPEMTCELIDLSDDDAKEMLSLAELTNPGPFLERTHCLGDFIGFKIDGKLVAMAGERLKQPGYTEISGVCTHPDFRGRGLAAQLITAMTIRILNRHEVPYLHAFANNTAAIKIYNRLGFEHRTYVNVAVLEHKQQA